MAFGDGLRKHLKALDEKHKLLSEKEIAVGFPAGKCRAYPDGTSVVEVAAAHVYGTKHIPVRDFMRYASLDIKKKTAPLLEAMCSVPLGKAHKIPKLQEAAGMVAQQCIQQAVVDLDDPPNAPSTIKAKGSTNPLIDTGHMRNSVTFIVRKKKAS